MKKILMTVVLLVTFNSVFAQETSVRDELVIAELKLENQRLQAQVDSLETQLARVALMAIMSSDESLEAILTLLALGSNSSTDEQPVADKGVDNDEQSDIPFVTEDQALEYIEDNFSFYETNYVYKDVKLRRIDKNKFRVSLEICSRDYANEDYMWNGKVRTLTVNSDGTYNF